MAANPSTVRGDNPVQQIESRLADMERYADAGEWEKIESLLKRLPPLVGQVPIADRRDILLATRDTVERIRSRVIQQSDELGGRLATLKTGREATASYRETMQTGR